MHFHPLSYRYVLLLAFCLGRLSLAVAQNQSINTPGAGEQVVGITTITPSVNTGQDYSPWRDDNLSNLVQNCWLPANFQYVDVTLQLQQPTPLSRLSLFDWEGIFTAAPATIYAQYNGQRTLIGTFTGEAYNTYVNLPVAGTVLADAIVIHKYSNNIPVKVKVFGKTAASTPAAVTLTFDNLPARTVGATPFALTASSTNATTPITYSSSAPGVVSVSAATGQWLATVVGAGSATITASQAASAGYQAASASQVQVVAPAPTATTSGRIPIDGTRWYSLSNAPNDILGLFDGSTTTGFSERWGRIIPVYDAFYMLQPGETIRLESIRFYDNHWQGFADPMTLSVIASSGQRVPVASYLGGHYGQWVGPNPSQLTNFQLPAVLSDIRALVLTANWGYPAEIELYGSYAAGTPLPAANLPALAVGRNVKLQQQLGVNAFEWNLEHPNQPEKINEANMPAVKHFTGIRHYMDWDKLETQQGHYTYNPVHSGGWNYDALYQRCQAEGLEVLACLKTQPTWMVNTYPAADRDAENVPVRYGQDFAAPSSYLEQAKVAFQYAARYGRNLNVNPALLHVDPATRWTNDPANTVKIGLGYIKYLECDNERDKWWKGRKAYQTAFEYAANMSAFYDGHQNTLGPGVGVKNADPSMQVVMGGLASANPDYVRGMIDWCRQHRGYRADGSVNLCWDIINYHLYVNNEGTAQGAALRGVAPEVSTAAQTAQAFLKMAHQYAADQPVWVTEAGYDVNQGSPFHAIVIGSKSVAQVQADWTLRLALLHARWGIERTYFYQFTDDYPNNAIQFGSMGLINADLTPTPAATYLQQANALLGSYTYTGTVSSDPLVDRYEANGKTIYALVVPDEQNRTATYTLDLGKADSARIYQPQASQVAMSCTRLRTQGGKITLTVTETPQFVRAGGGPATASTPASSCAGTGSVQWEQWTNVGGVDVSSIPTQTPPNATATLTQLEAGRNIGDFYGARIRGYLCPPQSGNYVFRLAGDDDCQLWLSPTDQAASKVLVAGITGWTGYRQWNKYASQQSASVPLVAGQRYYFEVLHKEATGEDNVSVAWTLPSGTEETPIAGSHLLPYQAGSARPAATTAPGQAAAGTAATAINTPELTVYPTPFTDQTTIEFTLPAAEPVTLSVFDASGRLVQRLLTSTAEAGVRQQFILLGAKLSPGIYTVQLFTPNFLLTKKLSRIN